MTTPRIFAGEQRKLQLLYDIEAIGATFATSDQLQMKFLPNIWIDRLGYIGVPLCNEQVRSMETHMSRVGSEVAEAQRRPPSDNSKPPLRIEFRSDEWRGFLDHVVKEASSRLGVHSNVYHQLEGMYLESQETTYYTTFR